MDVENSATGLVIRKWKFNLPVDSSWPNQCRVEAVNPVGGHDHLDIAARIEAVELE